MVIAPQAQPIARPTQIMRPAMKWINTTPEGGMMNKTTLDAWSMNET
jgi:hypothetical protein